MTASLVGQYAIGTFASPTNNTTADADTVRGNDNTIATQHNAHDSNSKLHIQQGLFSERPAFGTAGQVYLATDTFRLYVDTGAAWVEVRYQPTDASGNVVISGVLSLAGAVAASGAMRVANGTGINWRNSTASGDVAVLYVTTNESHLGGESAVVIDVGGGTTFASRWDASVTADETRFLLWDVSAGTMKRVTRGAVDSGGVGFRVLRIPN